MILTFVAVGKKYIDNLNRFFKLNESLKNCSIVLTNEPSLFTDVKTVKYSNKIFSYFDKLLFTLRICEDYKDNVLYVDCDELFDVNIIKLMTEIGEKETSVLYTINWPPKNLNELSVAPI